MTNELDNLKNAWKTISEADPVKDYSVDELKKIVKKKSNNELLKIRRKFILEWTLALALSAFIVIYVQFLNKENTIYALTFVAFILLVSILPYLNVLKVKSTSQSSLKVHLTEFIAGFEKLVSQYMKIATVLLPIAITGGVLLGTHSSIGHEEWISLFTIKRTVLLIIIIASLSFGSYLIQKRYFNWIYGKNLKRLKACLKDLEAVEDAVE